MDENTIGLFILAAIVFFILFIRTNNKLSKVDAQLKIAQKQISDQESEIKNLNHDNERLQRELHEKRIESLRFVLNPHSVRNTLNTIHGLANRTYAAVQGLTGIFDYMLYESQQNSVTLQQEVSFARKYLNLYCSSLKSQTRILIDLDMAGCDDFMNEHVIAPLITAHFIENAFKHGDFDQPDSFIDVHMEVVSDHSIIYSVRNKIKNINSEKKPGGLGKVKMMERLDLMYRDRYTIDYVETSGVFSANLKLKLDEQKNPMHHR